MGPGPALLASSCIWWGPSVQLSLHTDLPEARPMPQGLRRGHPVPTSSRPGRHREQSTTLWGGDGPHLHATMNHTNEMPME